MHNEDYLMHFNPFHDPKNGQFASGGGTSGRGARRYQKQLNKLSNKMYKSDAEYNKALWKELKYGLKSGKYDLDSAKNRKYEDKAAQQTRKKIEKGIESSRYQDMANKILNEAKEKGYTVDSKEVVRDAAAGRKMAGYFFGGAIGYRIAENASGGNLISMVSTSKYKVRR